MSKIAVVYWSGTGNTEAMAKLVEEGIVAAGGQADLLPPALFTPDLVSGYDAIAFGCPSMGAEQLEEGEFQPMFDAVKGSLGGKTIGLFGSYGWGDGEWMESWEAQCRQDGAVLACGSVICNEAPDDEAQEACRNLGKALA